MNWLNISCDERDCMIYLCLFKIFKRFEKVVLDFKFKKKWGKNRQKWAKMAVPNPAIVHY